MARIYPEIESNPADHRHGTYSGYHNNHCRCDRCTEANRIYQRTYMATSPLQIQLRAERAAAKPPLQGCGTPAGYHRHWMNAETPCEACVEAHRRYGRKRRGWPEDRLDEPFYGGIVHGTNAGAKRHKRAGETLCPECLAARRRYDREQKRLRRRAVVASRP